MQSNSEKQNINSSSSAVYPSYQTAAAPPPYPGDCQVPSQNQRKIVLVPLKRGVLGDIQLIPITHSLKTFLLLSGFIYALWGILALSIHIAIIINSYSTHYYSFLTGIFLILGGIIMMIVGLQSSYPLSRLTRMYVVDLMLCIIGVISSIFNYTLSTRCSGMMFRYCDDDLSSHLKIIHIVIFGLSTIHTIINMFYLSNEEGRAKSRPSADILNS